MTAKSAKSTKTNGKSVKVLYVRLPDSAHIKLCSLVDGEPAPAKSKVLFARLPTKVHKKLCELVISRSVAKGRPVSKQELVSELINKAAQRNKGSTKQDVVIGLILAA